MYAIQCVGSLTRTYVAKLSYKRLPTTFELFQKHQQSTTNTYELLAHKQQEHQQHKSPNENEVSSF